MTLMMRMPMAKRVKAPAATRTLLSGSDFTYLGKYSVDRLIGYNFGGGGELNFGCGFTTRRVAGELRFMTYGYISGTMRLVEFAKPASLGDTISTATNVWSSIAPPRQQHGISWDEANSILWTTDAFDYPATTEEEQYTKSISTRVLNSNGTVSTFKGFIGLQGINGRRIYGGMCRIPSWFQTVYSVPPYAVGFGGYTSRLAIGPISLGPTMYAIPDPRSYSDDTEIPTGTFKTLMDHSSGSVPSDWYGGGTPSTFDRGLRFTTNITNDYEAGQWLSPSPDGYGRFTWGDTCSNTACWIDNDAGTRPKHGFVLVPTLGTGRVWYEGSTLNYEGKSAEIQVFNPLHFGEVVSSSRAAWNVQPVAGKDLSSNITEHQAAGDGFYTPGGICGASYDAADDRLYVYGNSSSVDGNSTIYVYSVGGA